MSHPNQLESYEQQAMFHPEMAYRNRCAKYGEPEEKSMFKVFKRQREHAAAQPPNTVYIDGTVPASLDSQQPAYSVIEFGGAMPHKQYMRPIVPYNHPTWMTIHIHGQDTNSICRNFPGGGKDESGVVNTDGHGIGGENWSVLYNIAVSSIVVEKWWTIKRILRKKSDDSVDRATSYLKQLMLDAETVAAENLGSHAQNGGTTCTATFVMIVRNQRYIIQAAVGDGPGGIFVDGVATPTVIEANGDNTAAVQCHVDRRVAAGVKPEMVVYSRINISRKIPPIEYPPNSGRCDPIPAYKYIPRKDGGFTVIPNAESYNVVRPHYAYGVQSRNHPPIYLRAVDQFTGNVEWIEPEGVNAWKLRTHGTAVSSSVWSVKPDDMAANFGNSVLGGSNGQNLTGAGDYDSDFCTCSASVSIQKLNKPCMVYGMSDGIGDLFSQTKICTDIMQLHAHHSEVDIDTFREHVSSEIIDEPAYSWLMGCPKWDDISFCAIVLPEFKPSKKHRRRKY